VPVDALAPERALLSASVAARKVGDLATARSRAAEAIALLLARPEAEQDDRWLEHVSGAGLIAWNAGDPRTAHTAFVRAHAILAATRPDDDADLQTARQQLSSTRRALGDNAGGRALLEQVLDVYSRTLSDDHSDLQLVRHNLAVTLWTAGEYDRAKALLEQVLSVRLRTLADESPELQSVRGDLAVTLRALGDLQGARDLQEQVLAVTSRTLPEDHVELQRDRNNLAVSLKDLGDFERAKLLFAAVVESRSRTLSPDHLDLQEARHNLAATLSALGDLRGARDLEQQTLEICSSTLPDDHPTLQLVRMVLSNAMHQLGDLQGARALQEKLLDVYSRTLPEDDPVVQRARGNLAATLKAQGDLRGARVLEEQVLEVRSRILPDDDAELQWARGNLAATCLLLGDFETARALQAKAVEVCSATMPDDALALQTPRATLALTLKAQGDFAGARALEEQVLGVLSRKLSDDHPHLQSARGNLAVTVKAMGDFDAARVLDERVLELRTRTLPDDHPDLQIARHALAVTLASGGKVDPSGESQELGARCAELMGALCRAQQRAALEAIVGGSSREAEERCSYLALSLDQALSFAGGYGVFEASRALALQSFALSETLRGAAVVSAELARSASDAPEHAELRAALRTASDELAALVRQGTTSQEFERARAKRESAERALVDLARRLPGGVQRGVDFDVEALTGALAPDEVAVGFRRFEKTRATRVDERAVKDQPASVPSLCAFVVRSPKDVAPPASGVPQIELVDLGPIAAIEESVRAWRSALGVSSDSRGVAASAADESASSVRVYGAQLRERILDPLIPVLGGAQRIVVALDDVLHLVPLDALPLDERHLVGDRWQIQTRTTLTELLLSREPFEQAGPLVALGDVDYGATSVSGAATLLAAADVEPRPAEHAGILRGGAWAQGFAALPGTGVEVRGIEREFRDRFGADAAVELCERTNATRERLLALAPTARYLHIATHGWFAPESIRSWRDSEPLDKLTGLGSRMSGEEQVKGMSPMLLCGLALAGANLPETAASRVPGLVTADELSTLDLSNCELVVLSACETNVGERRAGQGVASLQKALQMAGARSVVTSLWKVPDEATKELMLDFYRRLWVEKKPKWQALWEAKTRMREAKDERGEWKYSTRDWAAWVLTGSPE
jgi:CHAT domain-containing protein/tetratricopeptide (TPR) repeat protein